MDDFGIFVLSLLGGVIWGGTTSYCIRVRDYALSIESKFRHHYDPVDHAVELVIAGFCGFICATGLHGAGVSPALIVGAASLASFLNRSFFQIAYKYAPVLVAQVTNGDSAAALRAKKLADLEKALVLETRPDEIFRLRELVRDVKSEAATESDELNFPTKMAVTNRLGNSWMELADYFDVPQHHRSQWALGREPHGLLLWVADRGLTGDLPAALVAIGREDLAELLRG